MIKSLPGERWKQLTFKNWKSLQKKYAISTQGRIASYIDDIKKDGNIISGSTVEAYRILRLKVKGKHVAFLFHRLVAENFLTKPSAAHDYVIHLNHDKIDNRRQNLKWATIEQVGAHNRNNPRVLEAQEKRTQDPEKYARFRKLSLKQVIAIKKLLADPKRKMSYRQIAEKYDISQMALTRMKRGENWGYVKI